MQTNKRYSLTHPSEHYPPLPPYPWEPAHKENILLMSFNTDE